MLRIHARVSTMLLTLAALLIFAACQPSDPWEQLALARQDYRVETRNWIPTDPQPIEPAADADGDAEADGTADAESDVPTKFTSAIINFTVGERAWTGVMILSYMFALMGIQSSPAFTMWTFGIKDPKPLAWQHVFMSTFIVGFALFFFTAFLTFGALSRIRCLLLFS